MISWQEITIRLALAALFGAVVGLERERKHWAAGLRTHMLVCVGSALTMIVSAYGFEDVLHRSNVVLDPSRVAAQVISGIGFLGAGTILFLRQGIVRGLTTAAGLWTVAAIGLATGGGLYFAASIATALAIVILLLLKPFEKKFDERFFSRQLKITAASESRLMLVLTEILHNNTLKTASFFLAKTDDEYAATVTFDDISTKELETLIRHLRSDPEIHEVSWNN